MVEKGADPNIINSYGESALFYACYHDNEDMIKILVSSGANFLSGTSSTGNSRCDDPERFELLQIQSTVDKNQEEREEL